MLYKKYKRSNMKRVLSFLTTIALIFSICLTLTGCNDSVDLAGSTFVFDKVDVDFYEFTIDVEAENGRVWDDEVGDYVDATGYFAEREALLTEKLKNNKIVFNKDGTAKFTSANGEEVYEYKCIKNVVRLINKDVKNYGNEIYAYEISFTYEDGKLVNSMVNDYQEVRYTLTYKKQ